jgi:TPP-dependent pyruvate/acetoin dehydrogenase alpha subunit
MVESLYEEMYRIRVFETLLVPYILDGTIKTPCHLCIGQEAIAVGVCKNLRKNDYVFGNHRSHGHYLAKGGDMKALACEIFGKAEGCSRGYGGSMHICDPGVNFMGTASIVAGSIGLAVGAAMAAKLRKENRISVVFLGDGATNEGVFWESVNLAVLYELPVLFVLENNGYSTHMAYKDIQGGNPVRAINELNCDSVSINGNSVMAVNREMNAILDHPIFPFLMECKTYRLCGHVGPNDNVCGKMTDIRPEKEVAEAWENDPLRRYSEFIPMGKAGNIYNEISDMIEYAAHEAEYPKEGSFRENVFC